MSELTLRYLSIIQSDTEKFMRGDTKYTRSASTTRKFSDYLFWYTDIPPIIYIKIAKHSIKSSNLYKSRNSKVKSIL